jgi:hypothetical protein
MVIFGPLKYVIQILFRFFIHITNYYHENRIDFFLNFVKTVNKKINFKFKMLAII